MEEPVHQGDHAPGVSASAQQVKQEPSQAEAAPVACAAPSLDANGFGTSNPAVPGAHEQPNLQPALGDQDPAGTAAELGSRDADVGAAEGGTALAPGPQGTVKAPSTSGPSGPSIEEIYKQIMLEKKEKEEKESGATTTSGQAALLGHGASINMLPIAVAPGVAATAPAPADAAAGAQQQQGQLAEQSLAGLGLRQSTLDQLLPAPTDDGRALQIARSTTMDQIMKSLSGFSGLDDGSGLLHWASMAPEKFMEGLASDMREIQAVPPAAGAMKRTFAVERAISGAQGDLSVLVREAEANGGSISIQGGKGVVTALAGMGPGPSPPLSLPLKRDRDGGLLPPAPYRTQSGRVLDLTMPPGSSPLVNSGQPMQQPQQQPPQQQDPSMRNMLQLAAQAHAQADRLEAENGQLKGALDTLLLQVEGVQQENNRMKEQLLELCLANGINADLSQLNSTIAMHRPSPISDAQAAVSAATVLAQNRGNVASTIQQLMTTAFLQCSQRGPGAGGAGGGLSGIGGIEGGSLGAGPSRQHGMPQLSAQAQHPSQLQQHQHQSQPQLPHGQQQGLGSLQGLLPGMPPGPGPMGNGYGPGSSGGGLQVPGLQLSPRHQGQQQHQGGFMSAPGGGLPNAGGFQLDGRGSGGGGFALDAGGLNQQLQGLAQLGMGQGMGALQGHLGNFGGQGQGQNMGLSLPGFGGGMQLR